MRLINADSLVEAIKDYPYGFRGMVECNIAKLPTIEPKNGKWIFKPTEPLGYECSVCGKGCCRFNFCPNCGARMTDC